MAGEKQIKLKIKKEEKKKEKDVFKKAWNIARKTNSRKKENSMQSKFESRKKDRY